MSFIYNGLAQRRPTDGAWGNTSQMVEMARVLFKGSPIVEISALTQLRLVCLLNYLRLAR
jgi:hypothetical protein